jgi:hypothetical protein
MSNAFVAPSEILKKRVANLVEKRGLAAACKELRIGESAVLRILNGLQVRRGTIALVEQGLRA